MQSDIKAVKLATLLVCGVAIGFASAVALGVHKKQVFIEEVLRQHFAKEQAERKSYQQAEERQTGKPYEPPHSILSTNYDERLEPQDEVRDIPVESRIYDIGHVVYSKAFAERHGYPEKYVAELDPGMQALEFRMKSDGGSVRCYLNMLLDNNLGLDLPEHDYVERFNRRGEMMRFPQKIESFKDSQGWEGYREHPEDKEFRMSVRQYKWNYYDLGLLLASYNYDPGKQTGWASSYRFESYTNRYFKNLDYLSMGTTCGRQPRKQLLQENASIWIKKREGDNLTKATQEKPDQFLKFRLPKNFAKQSVVLMERDGDYYFLNKLK